MQRLQHRTTIRRQRGVTSLFVTMVVLLVVMLLGVTAALLSSTQFKLAGNLQLENEAFNQAEVAVNAAQTWLITNYQNAAFTTASSSTPWLVPLGTGSAMATTPWGTTWTDSNSCAVFADNTCGVG